MIAFLFLIFAGACSYQQARAPLSMAELRNHGMVRQIHEFTCGAASLATVLTALGRPTTELEMLELHYEDKPFSLAEDSDTEIPPLSAADIQTMARKLGYKAVTVQAGEGEEALKALQELKPAIARVYLYKEYPHFVILRGEENGWIYISDPAYGNIRLPLSQFARVWEAGDRYLIAVGALPFQGWKDDDGKVYIKRDPADTAVEPAVVAPIALYQHARDAVTFSNVTPETVRRPF